MGTQYVEVKPSEWKTTRWVSGCHVWILAKFLGARSRSVNGCLSSSPSHYLSSYLRTVSPPLFWPQSRSFTQFFVSLPRSSFFLCAHFYQNDHDFSQTNLLNNFHLHQNTLIFKRIPIFLNHRSSQVQPHEKTHTFFFSLSAFLANSSQRWHTQRSNLFALSQLKVRMHRLNQKSLSAFLWQHLKEHFSKKKKKNQPWRPNEIKMDYELHSAVSCQRLTRPVVHRAAVPQDVKEQLLISFPPSWKGIISNRVTHQPRLCARVMCITDSEKWSVWNLTPYLPLKRYSVCVCSF